MQRQDFPEEFHGHQERPPLERLVKRINARARAQVFTGIIKCLLIGHMCSIRRQTQLPPEQQQKLTLRQQLCVTRTPGQYGSI
jgi:hypothetical protein